MKPLLIGIGDLHGHYPALNTLLHRLDQTYSIFDSDHHLRPEIQLVFTGDYVDRGQQNLPLLTTLMALAQENPTQVVQLFGNHELMALAALQRARELLQESPESTLYTKYTFGTLHGRNGGTALVTEFGKDPKEAFEQFTTRLSREGDIGKWMRNLKPLHFQQFQNHDVLFVHGGIPKTLASSHDLENYLDAFSAHMQTRTVDFVRNSLKFSRDEKVDGHSLFWDRRIPRMQQQELETVLDGLGVDYLVIGHTPQLGITNYFNRAFNVDVGMCPAYGEHEPAAIVFKPEGIFAFYANKGEEKLSGYK